MSSGPRPGDAPGKRGNTGASLTFIDLFCGCGGFSLGMERAGFGFASLRSIPIRERSRALRCRFTTRSTKQRVYFLAFRAV